MTIDSKTKTYFKTVLSGARSILVFKDGFFLWSQKEAISERNSIARYIKNTGQKGTFILNQEILSTFL